ncbi:MAG TPA: adenylate/guanylate cyclase domain-containing protein [Methyloceanibacter sp.]|nr:adenylate/guanylate cyclase domain-containing protein [Methyloceanibacter sp.]
MDTFDPTNLPDTPDIPASIVASGLSDAPLTTLVEAAMQRLVASGVPIDRMNVGFRILHPLFDGMSITWTRETGAEVFYAALVDKEGSEFRVSPFYVMLSDGSREWRLRLDRDDIERFPLLMQLREKGFTDYLALIVAFGGAELHPQSLDGLATSWSTRSPQGFSPSDIAAMRGVLTPLALVFRLAIKDQITKSALNTFHGPLVGGRILSGTIKRGDGERLAAALWYSDLRNSTGLADQLPVDAFLDLLNAYFDCAAGAVMEQGGQVLDIIGDAILAFFPAGDNGGAEACALALEAAAGARERLAELKREGSGKARAIEFGIGVHFGDVVFGNAGTPERLKFGVLGRAVNDVAHTADMSKSLKRPVVVSDEVARRANVTLADLGLHELRGIPQARRLWAMEVG